VVHMREASYASQVAVCLAVAAVAGGVGILVGMLIAPASGQETRRRWRRRAEDEVESLERRGHRALEDAKSFVKDQVEER
jgi:gas vesicle protein